MSKRVYKDTLYYKILLTVLKEFPDSFNTFF